MARDDTAGVLLGVGLLGAAAYYYLYGGVDSQGAQPFAVFDFESGDWIPAATVQPATVETPADSTLPDSNTPGSNFWTSGYDLPQGSGASAPAQSAAGVPWYQSLLNWIIPSAGAADVPAGGYPNVTLPTVEKTGDGNLDSRIWAFMQMVYEFESQGDYGALVGGGSVTDLSHHPADGRFPAPAANWKKNQSGNWFNPAKNSSAAGAGQFIWSTWSTLARRLGLTDFSEGSQDQAMLELLYDLGAIQALESGSFDLALQKASVPAGWASLPYSTSGQYKRTVADATAVFNRFLTS